jgi:hypothetical protein
MSYQLQKWHDRLLSLHRFERITQFEKGGVDGVFSGKVTVKSSQQGYLLQEEGVWQDKNITVFNCYRIQLLTDTIVLAHLRQGEDQPVLLCEFSVDGENLIPKDHHRCGEDNYYAQMQWKNGCLELIWNVVGPNKQGAIITHYFSAISKT